MPKISSMADELDALLNDLEGNKQDETTAFEQPASLSSRESDNEIERVLQDLKQCFEGVADEAEELVAEHPITSLTAAFILGVFVGRILGGLK
jgi:ElaB/YqjD/DUF883 family membrane-anchored ribosome-binding protein